MEEYYESSLCPVAFFTELDVLRALSKTEYHVVKDPIDFSVDLIHAPFHMTFTEEPYTEYACYTRNELGPCEEPDFSLKNTGDEEPKLQTGTDFDELPVAGVMLFYLMKLKEYVHDNGIIQQYVGMDPAREGVLLYRFGDEIRHKLVSGKQRPDLMCKTLFQGDAMKRPYEDEISSAWDEELLPFAKKLEAAENGDVEMMKAVSKACRNGEDDDSAKVEMDPEKAAFWMEQAAENADAEAMHDVGLFYARGYGVKRDFRSAAKWMDRAAEEGVYGAYEKAVEYHKAEDAQQRAESGDPQGMGDYASILMTVDGALSYLSADENYRESIQWAEKAAGKDNGESCWILGLAYEHGRAVEQDAAMAAQYYRRGAEQGHAVCLTNLGKLYMAGEGVEQDREKGFALYLQSAQKGYGIAMANIGYCCLFQVGTEHDLDKAIEWFEKSLEVLPDPVLGRRLTICKVLAQEGWPEELENESLEDKLGWLDMVFKEYT